MATLAMDIRNKDLNMLFISSLVIYLETEQEDMMMVPPVGRGLMAVTKEVAVMSST